MYFFNLLFLVTVVLNIIPGLGGLLALDFVDMFPLGLILFHGLLTNIGFSTAYRICT